MAAISKRIVIALYCHEVIGMKTVQFIFKHFNLKHV